MAFSFKAVFAQGAEDLTNLAYSCDTALFSEEVVSNLVESTIPISYPKKSVTMESSWKEIEEKSVFKSRVFTT